MDAYYSETSKNYLTLDESTVRKKLVEYIELGLIKNKKEKGRNLYCLSSAHVPIGTWHDAIAFYSEVAPMGVIGSYIQNQYERNYSSSAFIYKHHYILTALDSEVVFELCKAMREHRQTEITMWTRAKNCIIRHVIVPVKIYVSVQNGRQYILATQEGSAKPLFYRLDLIKSVKIKQIIPNWSEHVQKCDNYRKYLWGVSGNEQMHISHLVMKVHVAANEEYIVKRLEREKRNGNVRMVDSQTWCFETYVYDPIEMLPWIRTFTGRIIDLQCDDPRVVGRYYDDLQKMLKAYEGDTNAV